jgi:hypothetical protein
MARRYGSRSTLLPGTEWKLVVEGAGGLITVIDGDGSCAVYRQVNLQSLPPRSVNVVKTSRSLDDKNKGLGMAGPSNPHNINGEASTQTKTSKNKANYGKGKLSRKEKARRAAQQSKANAANAQKLKDDEALAAKQVEDRPPMHSVQKDATPKTYANAVSSSSLPSAGAPAVVPVAPPSTSTSPGKIVNKVPGQTSARSSLPSAGAPAVVPVASPSTSTSPGKIENKVPGQTISRSAKPTPLDPGAAPWTSSSTSPSDKRKEIVRFQTSSATSSGVVTETIAPDSWFPESASSRVEWESQLTRMFETEMRGYRSGQGFYRNGTWHVLYENHHFVGNNLCRGEIGYQYWYSRDKTTGKLTSSSTWASGSHLSNLLEAAKKACVW